MARCLSPSSLVCKGRASSPTLSMFAQELDDHSCREHCRVQCSYREDPVPHPLTSLVMLMVAVLAPDVQGAWKSSVTKTKIRPRLSLWLQKGRLEVVWTTNSRTLGAPWMFRAKFQILSLAPNLKTNGRRKHPCNSSPISFSSKKKILWNGGGKLSTGSKTLAQ